MTSVAALLKLGRGNIHGRRLVAMKRQILTYYLGEGKSVIAKTGTGMMKRGNEEVRQTTIADVGRNIVKNNGGGDGNR